MLAPFGLDLTGSRRLTDVLAHQPHFGDTPALSIHDRHGEATGVDLVADRGNLIEKPIDKAAEGIVIFAAQLGIQLFIQLVQTDLGVDQILVVADALEKQWLAVVLILDVADNLLYQVLYRDQARD